MMIDVAGDASTKRVGGIGGGPWMRHVELGFVYPP